MASDKRCYIWVNKEEASTIANVFKNIAESSGKYDEIARAVEIVKMAEYVLDDLAEREAEEDGE